MTTSLETMYPLVVGNRAVKLASAFVAGTDTTISLTQVESSSVPDAPNKVTIIDRVSDDEEYVVTVGYTGISGTSLTGVTVDEYDVSASATHTYPIDSPVFRPFCKGDYDALKTNITNLNSGKVDKVASTSDFHLGIDATTGELYFEV